MNYYSHGHWLIHEPYRLAGVSLPDWLNVVDRKVRVRRRHVEPYLTDHEPRLAALAAGILQHHADDEWFHATQAFMVTCADLTQMLRKHIPAADSMRIAFLGHVLVEILLDATLIQQYPARLDDYYRAMSLVDPNYVESSVVRMTGKPLRGLAGFIRRFCDVQFLRDYLDDLRLVFRLNQVMQRVGLAVVPDPVLMLLPRARQLVAERIADLLGHALYPHMALSAGFVPSHPRNS